MQQTEIVCRCMCDHELALNEIDTDNSIVVEQSTISMGEKCE